MTARRSRGFGEGLADRPAKTWSLGWAAPVAKAQNGFEHLRFSPAYQRAPRLRSGVARPGTAACFDGRAPARVVCERAATLSGRLGKRGSGWERTCTCVPAHPPGSSPTDERKLPDWRTAVDPYPGLLLVSRSSAQGHKSAANQQNLRTFVALCGDTVRSGRPAAELRAFSMAPHEPRASLARMRFTSGYARSGHRPRPVRTNP